MVYLGGDQIWVMTALHALDVGSALSGMGL